MNIKWIQGLIALATLGFVAQANAGMFGTEVTISDNNYRGSGWYSDREDEEVEVDMIATQAWDLEGTFIDGSILTLVGSYDFENGLDGFNSGDLFLSTSIPIYGDIDRRGRDSNNKAVKNIYGYDYVLDIDFETGSYDIVEIDAKAKVQRAYYTTNEGSSPWRYVSGGNVIGNGNLGLQSGLTNAQTNFQGDDNHYAMSFDLSDIYASLGESTTFYSHFTMGCGNDNLMGNWTVVPEPATFALFGIGILGLLIARRKRPVDLVA